MRSIILALALATGWVLFAGESKAQEELDFSALLERFEDGVPDKADVDQLIAQAVSTFESEDCRRAIPQLAEAQARANHLANLITIGLEPFYDASYDDRRSFRGVGELAPFEAMSNEYKRERNRLMVMEAECLLNTNQTREGIVRLYRALELIDIDNGPLWNRARDRLYSEIGVIQSED